MKLTIGRKLAIGIGSILVLLAIIAAISYSSLTSTVNQYKDLSGRVQVAMEQARRLNARMLTQAVSTMGYVITQDEAYRQEYEQSGLEADESLSVLKSLVQKAEAKVLLSDIEDKVQAYRTAAQAVFDDDTISVEEAQNILRNVLRKPRTEMSTSIDAFIAWEENLVETTSHETDGQAIFAQRIVIGISALALLLGIFAGIILAKSITTPIGSLIEVLNKMAEGDLTKRLTVTSADEIGELSKTFNRFVDRLASTIKQVAQSANEVEEASVQLADASDQQAEAAGQVASIISQVAQGVQEQSSGDCVKSSGAGIPISEAGSPSYASVGRV